MKFTLILAILPGIATSFTAPSVFGAVKTAPVSNVVMYAAGTNGVNGSGEKKKVIVLGGDGFCGWPTSLYLSDMGHDVVIVDNLSRRNIDTELGCDSLTPIQSPEVCTL
jgi:UDP-sulfoquinovose synthase